MAGGQQSAWRTPHRRGIFLAQWTVADLPVLLAVDSRGNLGAVRPVPASWTLERAGEALRVWLEKDPAPQLRLVSDAPAKPANPYPPERYPELYMSRAQAYIRFGSRGRPEHRHRMI